MSVADTERPDQAELLNGEPMDHDKSKVEETVMALLFLTMFKDRSETRAWKGQDWSVLNALHERGWILDPRSKAKSVVLTEEGVRRAKELFEKHFVVAVQPGDAADDAPGLG